MKTMRLLCLVLAIALAIPAMGLAITDEEGAAWALEHGWVQPAETVASATQKKVGGVNFGAIEWTPELQKAAVCQFLKGGKYLGDPSFAQNETGNNYREMFQLATSLNNVPTNTNLEMVLDTETLHLLGVSEAGTGKTLAMQQNPNVSVSWCRQLRAADEETYNYYCSYGVTINGKVYVFSAADLETAEGQERLLNLFDKYYPTLASSWMGYAMNFAGLTDEAAIREAKLAYIAGRFAAGSMVIYEIIPSEIIITAPFLMNMAPQMMNGFQFVTAGEGMPKYAYTLELDESFLDMLVDYKASVIATEEGAAAVAAYYAGPMFQQLDAYCAQYGAPTSLQFAMMPNSAAGLKTQTTYIPE